MKLKKKYFEDFKYNELLKILNYKVHVLPYIVCFPHFRYLKEA